MGGAASAEVTLMDGRAEIVSGEVLGYDGRYWRLMTEAGELTLDGTGLECRGDCPSERLPARISGSPAAMRLLPPLIETFARRRGYDLDREEDGDLSFRLSRDGETAGSFRLRATTSAEAFADLVADEADLVLTQRQIQAAEAEIAAMAGRGDPRTPGRSAILALDALVPIVSANAPVEAISATDLARILTGEVTDWSDLGGAPAPIALHLPGMGVGIGEALAERYGQMAQGATYHDSNEAVSGAVALDPRALGISGHSDVGASEVLELGGDCGMRLNPSEQAIKTEDWPLTAPVFLYAPMRRLAPLLTDFVDYATSPAAQSVIRRSGFVDQFPDAIPLNAQGARLANAILSAGDGVDLDDLQDLAEALTGHVRLTPTFRFEDGSTRLDAQSRSNVALLTEAIGSGLFDGRTLTFAGFSDRVGSSARNRSLSRERAATVRREVLERLDQEVADRLTLSVAAFGEALPMSCGSDQSGRQINRRVEVWLR